MTQFILNNKKINTNANSSMVLADYIRENKNLKGTKIVCREGDCAACSVLVGSIDLESNSVSYQSITSCIYPLANIAGKHVVTIEGLNLERGLNVAQKSLKKHHGSQCGFCTPGFVVTLINYCLNPDKDSVKEALDAISGNICRCTGYVSIINAAIEVVQSCKALGAAYTLNQLIEKGFIPNYFEDIYNRLEAIQTQHQATTGTIIAGGTDLYVQKADKLIQQLKNRFITKEQSQEVRVDGDSCTISGVATATDVFENPAICERIPNWQQMLRLVSSEPIRNMATIAGNFVNASPIADMTAIMLAMDTELEIVNIDQSRKLKLEDFYLDYKVTDLKKNESIAGMTFKLPTDKGFFNFEKVSKRKYLDIATVNTAAFFEMNQDQVIDFKISMGGVAATPLLLSQVCEFLKGKSLNQDILKTAIEVMHKEISPITDVRGSAEYKRQLAENLFKAHFLELFPEVFSFQKTVAS